MQHKKRCLKEKDKTALCNFSSCWSLSQGESQVLTWIIFLLFFFLDMAQRNPGSGRSLKFVALAGNSCGSSRSEAGSRSKPVTNSAPTSRAGRSTVPPACTDGRCCHDETLKTHFESICSPSPSSFVLLEPGSRLVDILRFFSSFFCLSPQGLTVNRVKKPRREWWENVAFFTHCDCYFQHFENTFNGYSKEWKSWRKGPLSGYFDKEPSLLTFNQLQTEPEWL